MYIYILAEIPGEMKLRVVVSDSKRLGYSEDHY
jgi:hypothetical protein